MNWFDRAANWATAHNIPIPHLIPTLIVRWGTR